MKGFALFQRYAFQSLRVCGALLGAMLVGPPSFLAQTRADASAHWDSVHTPTPPPPVSHSWELAPAAEPLERRSQPPRWQVLDGTSADPSSAFESDQVTWAVLEPDQEQRLEQRLRTEFPADPELASDLSHPESLTTPSVQQIRNARFRGSVRPSFRSVSRNVVYGDTLYPEMGFWIPSTFRQAEDYRFTFSTQLLGNPTNNRAPDWCDWDDFWNKCSDGQFFAEVTPLVLGPVSLGVNYSQQESFLGSRSDGSFEQGGQAVGFQIKSNLGRNFGASVVGLNLWNPFGKGGPNGAYPAPGEEIQADLGRAYLFMGSAALDLGFWFASDTPALLAVTAGVGNGRYKNILDTQRFWINYGPYSPIGVVALAFNEHVSIFAEYQGQYNGFGMSLKPLKDVPVTATIMFRDFQGTSTGVVNCQGGDPDNCRTTVDGRLTLSF